MFFSQIPLGPGDNPLGPGDNPLGHVNSFGTCQFLWDMSIPLGPGDGTCRDSFGCWVTDSHHWGTCCFTL